MGRELTKQRRPLTAKYAEAGAARALLQCEYLSNSKVLNTYFNFSWMFFTLGSAILLSFGSLALLAVAQQRRRQQLQEQQQLAISKRQTTANAGSGNGVIRASAKVGKTTGSCHRTDERKLRNGPANDDQAESRSR
jgi:hypothetical protein